MRKQMKNKKGITLISLVITIILLLILAGVTINLTIGENSLFSKAKQAKEEYANAQTAEEEQLNELYAELARGDLPENTTETEAGTIVKLPSNWAITTMRYVSTNDGQEVTNVTKVSTVYAVSVGNGKTVPVPYGFWYVGGTLESGVVISDNKDDQNKYAGQADVPSGVEAVLNEDKSLKEMKETLKGNQFVWIPCDETGYVKTSFGYQNANWDTTVDMAGIIQTQKYGGFYVGRFEAGLATNIDEFTTKQKHDNSNQIYNLDGVPQSKAGIVPWNFIDWNNSQKNAKSMYNTNYVSSGLITGAQWDVMINKINSIRNEDETEKYSLTDSGSWGNYIDKTPTITLGKTAYAYVSSNSWYLDPFSSTWVINTEKPKGTVNTSNNGKAYLWTTGASETAKAYNLYDVAGNLWEWTEETSFYGGNSSTQYRLLRGGSCDNASTAHPVCYRLGNHTVSSTSFDDGFRVVLYIK